VIAIMETLLRRAREQRDLDYVIVYNVSRFARKMEDDVVIAADLERLGVRLVSATEHFDDTPFGKFMRRLLGAQAELYSENLSFEAKRGLHQKARLGGTPGPAPLGYLNVHKQIEGSWIATVEVDPDRATHIRWAFVAYASGAYTLDTLHAALKRRGLVTRKTRKYTASPVSRTHLARILANPYYAGIVRYGGVEYEGRHESLVDKDTFSRVQAVLSAQQFQGEGPQAPLPQGKSRLRSLRFPAYVHQGQRQRWHLRLLRLHRTRQGDRLPPSVPPIGGNRSEGGAAVRRRAGPAGRGRYER
jgi:site-specific DNA recombinase